MVDSIPLEQLPPFKTIGISSEKYSATCCSSWTNKNQKDWHLAQLKEMNFLTIYVNSLIWNSNCHRIFLQQ
jgi:hypothetical protein